MRGLLSILSLFRNESNTFNNTRARMLDSIYQLPTSYGNNHSPSLISFQPVENILYIKIYEYSRAFIRIIMDELIKNTTPNWFN